VKRLVAAAAASLALLLGGPIQAKELSDVKTPLENLGVDPDARGKVRLRLQENRATFQVKVRRLDPSAVYELRRDSVPVGEIATDGAGAANVVFRAPESGSDPVLDFDPRGSFMSVGQGELDVLGAVVSGGLELDGIKIQEKTSLEPTELLADFPKAEARLKYEVRPNGKRKFELDARHLPPGTYEMWVIDEALAETEIASFTTNPAGNAKVTFGFAPPKKNGKEPKGKKPMNKPGRVKGMALDFDPRTATIEIRQGEDVYFSGSMLAQIPGLNVCEPESSMVDLALVGSPEQVFGVAAFEVAEDCSRTFEVGIGDDAGVTLTPGLYDLSVGSDLVGEIEAQAGEGGAVEGGIAFFSEPEEEQLALTFDPRGQTVGVEQETVGILTGDLP
jgi:hypothetical protein